MFKVEDIKSENPTISVCHACLSSNRLLTPLGSLQAELYHKICFDSIFTIAKSEVSLCWECLAILRKMQLFREKVDIAQKMLTYYYLKQEGTPQSISNLSIVKIDTENSLHVIENVIDEKLQSIEETPSCERKTSIEENQNYEEKPSFEVKMENNENDDVFNYSDNEYTFLEDIKEKDDLLELVKEIKKESTKSNKKMKKNYKMLLLNRSAKSEVVTNEKIDQNQLKIWLERERNSDYFKNLKNKCDKCVCRIRENTIKLHNRVIHAQRAGQYICDICQTRFSSKNPLALHMSHHYNIQRCNICGYGCYTPAHMDHHLLTHTKSVQCLKCNACFANRTIFFNHYRYLHSAYICDHCSKRFKNRHSLIKHLSRKHTPHECKICSIVFKRPDLVRRHNLLKHVVNKTECAYCAQCGVQFDNELLYKRHVATSVAHAAERKQKKKEKVQCTACSNVYSRKSYMMNHYRKVHEKNPRYYCQECDKYFLTGSRYKDHRLYRHEGYEKPKNHVCTICDRGFNTKRILVNHIRTHSGERPFLCSYCDSKFTQKQALTSHIKFVHLRCSRKQTAISKLALS